jgi:Fe2+ transport system protein B
VLVKLGRWAGLRTLVVLLATVITPLLVAFFWRMHAAGAFLVGIAAAELFLMLTLWLGEVRNTADEPTRLTTRSAHVLAIGSGLITVLLVPPLIAWTSEITRAVKIQSLAVLFVVAFVWVFVVVWRRLRAAQA